MLKDVIEVVWIVVEWVVCEVEVSMDGFVKLKGKLVVFVKGRIWNLFGSCC